MYLISAIRYGYANICCSLGCVKILFRSSLPPPSSLKEFLQRLEPESDEASSGLELDMHTESAMDDFGSPNSSGIESGSEGD